MPWIGIKDFNQRLAGTSKTFARSSNLTFMCVTNELCIQQMLSDRPGQATLSIFGETTIVRCIVSPGSGDVLTKLSGSGM